jgi:hypothetical protein
VVKGNQNVSASFSAPEARSAGFGVKEEWIGTRPGQRCLIHISAEDAGDACSVVEIVSSPGDGTPRHVGNGVREGI